MWVYSLAIYSTVYWTFNEAIPVIRSSHWWFSKNLFGTCLVCSNKVYLRYLSICYILLSVPKPCMILHVHGFQSMGNIGWIGTCGEILAPTNLFKAAFSSVAQCQVINLVRPDWLLIGSVLVIVHSESSSIIVSEGYIKQGLNNRENMLHIDIRGKAYKIRTIHNPTSRIKRGNPNPRTWSKKWLVSIHQ